MPREARVSTTGREMPWRRGGLYDWLGDPRAEGEVVSRLRDEVAELVRLCRNLMCLALEDPLTHLVNRRGLERSLAREMARVQRRGEGLALAIFDVDDFKEVNDRLGHGAGDLALQHVAALLTEEARAMDCVARLGGDEFAVLLPGAARAGGLEYTERVRAALAAGPFAPVPAAPPLSLSAGVADLSEVEGSADELFRLADSRLYAVKTARSAGASDGLGPLPCRSPCSSEGEACGEPERHGLFREAAPLDPRRAGGRTPPGP